MSEYLIAKSSQSVHWLGTGVPPPPGRLESPETGGSSRRDYPHPVREEASQPVTAHVQALQRLREESPSAASPSAGPAGEASPAVPPRPAAAVSRPLGPAPTGDECMAGGRDAAGHEVDDDASFLELTASLTAPSQARHHATAVLARWKLSPEATDLAEAVVSELMANAVVACGVVPGQPDRSDSEDADPVILALRLRPGRLVIEVADNEPSLPVLKDVDSESESGRGLHLVQAFSKEWGFRRSQSGGKVVFAVLGIPTMGEAND